MARKQGMVARPVSVPSPVGGWNAKNALSDMPPEDAVYLVNMFPITSGVMVRQGYVQWATGLPTTVNTVMAYNGGATSKLFAASGTAIYDVTTQGAVGAAAVTGLTNDKLIHTNFANTGGNYLYWVNGADNPQYYDGSTWTTPAITGFTKANASYVYATKQRVWFIEKNTLKCWYLPTAAVAGACTGLDLGPYCSRGGYLVAMHSWTASGGFGTTEYVVFITSEGEVVIWQGTDPSSSTTWALVGTWRFGSPLGAKCFAKAGGDLLILTKDGLTPLNQGRFFADLGNKENVTDKIQWAISQATSSYGSSYGWCLQIYPQNNMLLLNVPVSSTAQEQYVMNTVTGAWCNFTGWAANCWELLQDNIYFGGNTVVCKAWSGYQDNGSAISFSAKQAFSYYGAPGQLKRWTMIRPNILTNGSPGIVCAVNVDFSDEDVYTTVTTAPNTAGTWDSATWDSSVFGGDAAPQALWQGVNGLGYCAATRMKGNVNGISLQWAATDVVMERGGVI